MTHPTWAVAVSLAALACWHVEEPGAGFRFRAGTRRRAVGGRICCCGGQGLHPAPGGSKFLLSALVVEFLAGLIDISLTLIFSISTLNLLVRILLDLPLENPGPRWLRVHRLISMYSGRGESRGFRDTLSKPAAFRICVALTQPSLRLRITLSLRSGPKMYS